MALYHSEWHSICTCKPLLAHFIRTLETLNSRHENCLSRRWWLDTNVRFSNRPQIWTWGSIIIYAPIWLIMERWNISTKKMFPHSSGFANPLMVSSGFIQCLRVKLRVKLVISYDSYVLKKLLMQSLEKWWEETRNIRSNIAVAHIAPMLCRY